MKKIMTLIIGISLLFPSGALVAKERQGAQLVITKTDGKVMNGELTAVKKDSALLLKSPSGDDIAIDISDINILKIVEKSKKLLNIGGGFLICASIGALLGYEGAHDWAPNDTKGQWQWAGAGVVIGGVVGALLGAMVSSGHKETILIRGKSPEEIKKVLEKLRTQARFPEYQ